MIDFSLLKNIDFTNTDTLLFLAIFFVVVIIFFIIFLVILAKIIKIIKQIIVRLFNIDVKKPKLNQQKNNKEQPPNKPKPKAPDFTRNFNAGENPEKKQDAKSYEEKEQESILENLNKLKTADIQGKETLDSKMPSRIEVKESATQGVPREIKIPVPKRFSAEVKDENIADIAEDEKLKEAEDIEEALAKLENKKDLARNLSYQEHGNIKESAIVLPASQVIVKKTKAPEKPFGNTDSSIFNGGSEVSRIKLENEMETDTKIWKAAVQSGLTLNSIERAKLIKDIPQVYGRNISKTDLKGSIKKLNEKMSGVKNPAEHAKIRKEIKFFKKIGGIN